MFLNPEINVKLQTKFKRLIISVHPMLHKRTKINNKFFFRIELNAIILQIFWPKSKGLTPKPDC